MADDNVNVPYEAEWTRNLRHLSDPNRVQRRPPFIESGAAGSATADHSAAAPAHDRPAIPAEARPFDPQSRPAEPSYYDVPMVKPPVWKWEIATYFYLGGLSAGAYVLGRMADRFGGSRHPKLARTAAYVAMAALLPCPPLLIADLGDPKRFHHMLRIWKPSSPMNLGTWAIVAYSGMATYEVMRQYLARRDTRLSPGQRSRLLKAMNNGVLLAAHDAMGVPFALLVAGYTGVLLSCTANPLWSKNPWLGALFSASAIATGAEAVSLAMDLAGERGDEPASQKVLQMTDTLAHAAELACMKGFEKFAGEKAAPARGGNNAKYRYFSIGAIIGAEVLKRLPVRGRYRKPVRMAATALGLAAGLAMRWSMVFGGHDAANDPHASRLVSETDTRRKLRSERGPITDERRAHAAMNS